MEPFLSLNAATSAAPGDALDLESPVADFTLWSLNAGTGVAHFELQGSPDGTNWTDLLTGSAGVGAGAFRADTVGPRVPPTPVLWCRYVRAKLSIESGSPVASAWITAARPDGTE
jgi:hypothetical protein